jgi:hypothetical protein
MTWAILAFNVLVVVWLTIRLTVNTKNCGGLTTSECAGMADVAHSAVAGIQIVLWVIGDIILGVLWLVTRGRSGPACGRSVGRGLVRCKGCGHDFRVGLQPNG